jgi:hypothetical protein
MTLNQLNGLPDNLKKRVYRTLLPPGLLAQFGINPVTWQGPNGAQHVKLGARPGTSQVRISAQSTADSTSEFLHIELEDSPVYGINLVLLLIQDPEGPYFGTDRDEHGIPTQFGTAHRNLVAEEQAMSAGLAPAQVRPGLGVSREVLSHLESFLVTLGHSACFLEPLTYASAWLFERRGFAYVRGHKLMDDIHHGFQPGGRLYQALDGSTPFRQPGQWSSVRGRAWAIQDGILEVIGARWDDLRMVKRVGRHSGVKTFPDGIY